MYKVSPGETLNIEECVKIDKLLVNIDKVMLNEEWYNAHKKERI